MKRTPLLNRHLSRLAAELGHLDEIVVADAGLPCPAGVEVIDLSLTPGIPSLMDVLDALGTELVAEAAVMAGEASDALTSALRTKLDRLSDAGTPIRIETVSHEMFKARTGGAKAIIRTGECTPYANVILVSGVAF